MLKNTFLALAAIGAGILGVSANGANAFTLQQQALVQAGPSPQITEVRDRSEFDGGKLIYHGRHGISDDWRYSGVRCDGQSARCNYYHNGFWYQTPWWAMPMAGAGIAIGAAGFEFENGYQGVAGGRHERWCMDRYRSYNPRTNAWVSFGGDYNQCISPFGP